VTGRYAIEIALHWARVGLYLVAVALVFSVVRCFFDLGPRPAAWLSIGSFVVFMLASLISPFFISSRGSSCFS
jgi:hypothetical protein